MENSVLWMLGGILYCLPALSAHSQHHPHASAITIVNVLLGWTVIGWIVCLAWSQMKPR